MLVYLYIICIILKTVLCPFQKYWSTRLSLETHFCCIAIFDIFIFLPQILQKKRTELLFFRALSDYPFPVRYVIYPFPKKLLQPCLT